MKKNLTPLFVFISTFVFAQNNCNQKISLALPGNSTYSLPNALFDIDICYDYKLPMLIDSLPNSTIVWKFDGRDIPNSNVKRIDADKEGTYFAVVKQGNCEYTTSILKIRKVENFELRINTFFASSSSSDYDVFFCRASRPNLNRNYISIRGEAMHEWYKDGNLFSTNAFGTSIESNGSYYLKAKQGSCEVISNPLEVKFIDTLRRKPNYGLSYIIVNDSIKTCNKQITVSLDQGGDLEWYKNGILHKKVSNSSTITLEESGNYTYKFRQGVCEYTSNKPLFVEFGKQERVKMTVDTLPYCLDAHRVILRPLSYSGSNPTVKWFEADKQLSVGNSFVPTKAGKYYFVMTNPDSDCVTYSNPANVTTTNVNFALKIRNFSMPTDVSLCAGNIYKLSSNFFYFTNDYQWLKDGVVIKTPAGNFNNLDVTEGGTYKLKVKLQGCSYESNEVKVNINNPLKNISALKLDSCTTNSVVLKLDGATSDQSLIWKKDGTSLNTKAVFIKIPNTNSGTYSVDVASTCGTKAFKKEIGVSSPKSIESCFENIIKLSSNSPSQSYAWKGPNGFTSSVQNPEFKLSNTAQFGTYTVNSIIENCNFLATTTLSQRSLPKISTPKEAITICEKQNFEFPSVAEKSLKYQWTGPNNYFSTLQIPKFDNISRIQGGKYFIAVSDDFKCLSKDSLTLDVKLFVQPEALLSGGGNFLMDDSLKMKIDLKSYSPWQVVLSNGQNLSITKNPFEFKVKSTQNQKFTLTSIKNICGNGIVSGAAEFLLVLGSDDEISNKLEVFPLPTTDKIYIKLADEVDAIKLSIIDITGRMIYEKDKVLLDSNQSTPFDIEWLKPGIYYLKIRSKSKEYIKKISKI